ncbi:succinate dehydrogenase/fumarate reductase, flavoprotein subunit, partial [Vibrio parahaemolyticus V-223/04]
FQFAQPFTTPWVVLKRTAAVKLALKAYSRWVNVRLLVFTVQTV